jgi:hypothetical protein
MRKCRGTGKQKSQCRRSLPHRENSSPLGAPTGGPRATPRQGSRPLEGRRWTWRSNSRLTGTGTGAPAAGLSFLGSRGATASQWPCRLGPSMAAPWAQGEGTARPDQPWAQEGCRPEGGEICPDPPSEFPSGGRRRRLEADPRGFGQGMTPSPRSRRCPRHHRHRR